MSGVATAETRADEKEYVDPDYFTQTCQFDIADLDHIECIRPGPLRVLISIVSSINESLTSLGQPNSLELSEPPTLSHLIFVPSTGFAPILNE